MLRQLGNRGMGTLVRKGYIYTPYARICAYVIPRVCVCQWELLLYTSRVAPVVATD